MARFSGGAVLVFGMTLCCLYTAPMAWRSGTFESAAQAQNATSTCSCPPANCQQGFIAGCSVTCQSPQLADCRCEAACNSHTGGASGVNTCECKQ
ncbi:MAG: hypothetical protein H6Q33_3402 [Deltaproteobacteria bacterium]|nr:hypothetical protein [Deltaproteobacteria bacterium]